MPIFSERYVFTGTLALTSALHIGGGRTPMLSTDAPIVRTATGQPFIPGSSFKGAFRSTVEKLAGSAPQSRTCAFTAGAGCPGPQGDEQRRFNEQRRQAGWTEQQFVDQLEGTLCDTCKLFGTPFMASKLLFSDLYLGDGVEATTQIRDGVGIDRDSERAVDGIKYDFEVVDPTAGFDLRLTLDDPTATDLALTCMGLAEFVAGYAGLGGKRSRGLGNCALRGLQVYRLDLHDPATRAAKLRDYLIGKTDSNAALSDLTPANRMDSLPSSDQFLSEKIATFLSRTEVA